MATDAVPSASVESRDHPVAGQVERDRRLLIRGSAMARRVLTRLRTIRLDRMPRVGRLAGSGLALAAISGVVWFGGVAPLARDVEALATDVARLESAVRSGASSSQSPTRRLTTFVQSLPTRSELPAVLATVIAQATDAGLDLERGQYEFVAARSGKIARYRLVFPVRGTYPQLRAFIDGTLAAVPAVALEGLRLERGDVGEEVLDADLRFAIIVAGEA